MRTPIPRALALRLINHAASLLPPARAEWGAAMRSEVDHIAGNFEALLWASGCVMAAFSERHAGRAQTFAKLVKQPSAFLPLTMSVLALAVVLFTLAIFGVPHESDEGTAAHLWQLLMAGQVPLLLFFAVKWLPRCPRETLYIMGLQAVAMVAAMAPVFLLHL